MRTLTRSMAMAIALFASLALAQPAARNGGERAARPLQEAAQAASEQALRQADAAARTAVESAREAARLATTERRS